MRRNRSLFLLAAVCAASCSNGAMVRDASTPRVPGVFSRAVDASPGGGFSAVWVLARAARSEALGAAWIAGGSTTEPAGARGRLVSFDGMSTFRTRCTVAEVLEAVVARDGEVYAAGANGLVVRWTPSTDRCTPLTYERPSGSMPTLRTFVAPPAPAPVFVAGERDGRGVVFAIRGENLVEVPAPATAGALRSGTYDPRAGTWLAGEQGTMLALASAGDRFDAVPVPTEATSASFLSVSARERWAMALSGPSPVVVLARRFDATQWSTRSLPAGRANALHVELPWEVYFVGDSGFATAYNGIEYFEGREPLTSAPLRAVHGADGMILAVGGTQTGTVLIRGTPLVPSFTFDGTTYERMGDTVTDLGGSPATQN